VRKQHRAKGMAATTEVGRLEIHVALCEMEQCVVSSYINELIALLFQGNLLFHSKGLVEKDLEMLRARQSVIKNCRKRSMARLNYLKSDVRTDANG
jgi:hypothetical protein